MAKTSEFQDFVVEAIQSASDNMEDDVEAGAEPGPMVVKSIETFQERQIMTRDRGLVITMEDGTEFQVTIVKSKERRQGPREVDEITDNEDEVPDDFEEEDK